MNLFSVSFLAAFGALLVSTVMADFTSARVQIGRKKYELIKKHTTWDAAWQNCEADGNKMARINSAEEQRMLEQFLITHSLGGEDVWLGAHATPTRGPCQFMWVSMTEDFTPVTYAKWRRTPCCTSPKPQCLKLTGYLRRWTEADCEQSHFYLCEGGVDLE